jgi:hypothetical protein
MELPTDDDHKDHRQHHGVFRDILAALVFPKLLQESCHGLPHFL